MSDTDSAEKHEVNVRGTIKGTKLTQEFRICDYDLTTDCTTQPSQPPQSYYEIEATDMFGFKSVPIATISSTREAFIMPLISLKSFSSTEDTTQKASELFVSNIDNWK